jgi:hypothetical protein
MMKVICIGPIKKKICIGEKQLMKLPLIYLIRHCRVGWLYRPFMILTIFEP